MNTLENLTTTIQETNTFFLNKVQKQVNVAHGLKPEKYGCTFAGTLWLAAFSSFDRWKFVVW